MNIQQLTADFFSGDTDAFNSSYPVLLAASDEPVDWAYDIWDATVEHLTDKDNHMRSVAGQLLSNLAKSDPQKRLLRDLDKLVAVTRDERFVTARHVMQSLWKIGLVSQEYRDAIVQHLAARFKECITEKNCTLIRYDIIVCLEHIYQGTHDEAVRQTAEQLIATETDTKYQKKYKTALRKTAA